MSTPTLNLGELPPAALEDVELGAGPSSASSSSSSSSSAEAPPNPQELARLEALGLAALLVGAGTALAARRWPTITFNDEEKTELATAAAPVLLKYNLRSALAAEYKEEIALVMCVLGMVKKKMPARSSQPGDNARDINDPPGAPPGEAPIPESMSAHEAVQRGLYT